ncbi:MAG: glycosyltransferase [Kiritimatiellae bacterium]|nr:glycosyltransferase [Kiritimatiellia bacterium]
MSIELSIIVPVYQEEESISIFLGQIQPVLENLTPRYELIFCLDPGQDKTEDVIRQYIEADPRICLLVFTRRFGQPAATVAGIESCRGKACVVIDVDLQDPPSVIGDLYKKWKEGFDVVYAQRRSREGETFLKRAVSSLGYWIINRISEVPIPQNTGDFRLIDRKVIESLRGLKETHGFLRGLVAYVGFKQTGVLYDRDPRYTGRSKYNRFTGSLRIGMNGVVAFSRKPLTLASIMGFSMAAVGFSLSIFYILQKFIFNKEMTPGLASTIMIVTLFAGVQLICLGIMGEYIGRIYDEVRMRPKYMIARRVNLPEEPL